MQVHHNYKTKDLVDGGGLCSPGRWLPGKRNLPDLGDVGKDLITAMGVDLEKFEKESYDMFTGKLTSSPFPPEQIVKGKAFLEAWCKSWGFPGTKQPGDVDQEINIRLLQSFLTISEDPDAPALDCYAKGVFLGHNRRMPRTPAVFEEKKKWRLGYVPLRTIRWNG